jgi:hypothetical protein
MGYSKYFQANSLRSAVTNYKDYARLPFSATPDRPPTGSIRTYTDSDGFLHYINGVNNARGIFLTGIQATLDAILAAIKIVGSLTFDTYSVIIGGNGGTIPNTATGMNNLVTGCANAAPGSSNLVAGSGCTASSDSNLLTGMNNSINASQYQNANAVSGRTNSVTGEYNLVAGIDNVIIGQRNVVSGDNNHVTSSLGNEVSGEDQVVSGTHNSISGRNHNILGSFNHVTGEDHSLPDQKHHCTAQGHEAVCYNDCQHAHAAGKFTGSAVGSAQYTSVVAKGITTNLTPVELMVDTWSRIILAANKGYSFTVRVFGMISTLHCGYIKEMRGMIAKGANNLSTTLIWADIPTVDTIILDMGDGLTAVISADTTYGALKITVTGAENVPVRWIAYVEMLELSFL